MDKKIAHKNKQHLKLSDAAFLLLNDSYFTGMAHIVAA